MPIAIPIAAAAAEYGGSTLLASAAADTAFSAALAGTGTFAAADAAAATAEAGMTGLQALSLGASTIGGIGQVLQGQATSKADKYNAEIAANNATIAHQNATAVIQEGEANAAAASMGTKAKIGGILANQGASGVDVNSGSSVDVRSSAAQNGELNAINIRSQAARTAYGFETGATNATAESNMYKSEAEAAPITAGIGAASSMLTSAANPLTSPYAKYLSDKSLGSTDY